MTGNAMEEGLMTQINNPSHTDPSRIGFLAGAAPGLLIVIFLPMFVPRLTGFGALVIGLTVGLLIAVLVTRWLQKRIAARAQIRMIEKRTRDDAATVAAIVAMKAKTKEIQA